MTIPDFKRGFGERIKKMPKGKIKWFSTQIGAGVIRSDEGENVFFRFSAVHKNESTAMRRGQCVSFDVAKNLKSISTTAAKVKPFDNDG
jgi:cold shock CspA family protein